MKDIVVMVKVQTRVVAVSFKLAIGYHPPMSVLRNLFLIETMIHFRVDIVEIC